MNTTDPAAPYGRDEHGVPLPAPEGAGPSNVPVVTDPDAEIASLREQLSVARAELETAKTAPPPAAAAPLEAVAPASPSTTTTIGVAPPVVADEPNEVGLPTTHAIAPGSAGPTVREFAQLLELAGEKTYLSDPAVQNAADVFTDDLLEAARRVLHDHPEIAAADGAERQRLNRWISGLELVTSEVWGLINDVASSKAPAA